MLVEYIGNIIKGRRKELGITQLHLAELTELSINTIYKIEKGLANPSVEVLEKLLEVLGLTLKVVVNK